MSSTKIFPQFLSMSIEIEFSCGQTQHYPRDELRNFQYFEALFCSGMKDAEKPGILSKSRKIVKTQFYENFQF